LRHTFATELANANVSVYTLMKLLGHESMVTSQRYVDGAGTETRAASELNPLYDSTNQSGTHDRLSCTAATPFMLDKRYYVSWLFAYSAIRPCPELYGSTTDDRPSE
jgi:hypothetical protein